MKITDEMLSQAAPEAAERWLSTLPERGECEHAFSLTFEAAMHPLLKKRRRRWKTLVLLAAVIAALAALLASGVSADRPDEYGVYASQDGSIVSYLIRHKNDGVTQKLHQLTPEWLPEGFALSDSTVEDNSASAYYRLQSAPREKWITLKQWHNGEENGVLTMGCTLENTELDGEEAIYISSSEEPFNYLLWTRGSDAFFLTAKGLEREDIFRFAESLKW